MAEAKSLQSGPTDVTTSLQDVVRFTTQSTTATERQRRKVPGMLVYSGRGPPQRGELPSLCLDHKAVVHSQGIATDTPYLLYTVPRKSSAVEAAEAAATAATAAAATATAAAAALAAAAAAAAAAARRMLRTYTYELAV